MSKLKQAFEKICLHLQDWKNDIYLKTIIPIKDLRQLVHDYLLNEFEFENEFYALCFYVRDSSMCSNTNRIVRLFQQSPHQTVQKWWKTFYTFYPITSDWQWTLPQRFMHAFFYITETACNRMWCWYRNGDCICGHSLTYGVLYVLSKKLFN